MAGATLLAGVGGCAAWLAPQSAALRAAPPAGPAARAALADVPLLAQTRWHCGPAALAMVLRQAGFAADPDTLGAQVFLPAREGSLQLEMLAGARRQGAVAVRLPGTLVALFGQVAEGRAPVLLLNLGLAWLPRWHYVVLVGHDLAAGEVRLHTGAPAVQAWPLETLEATWARAGHWAFVVVAPGTLPQGITRDAAQQAALGFAHAAAPADALRAWQAVQQRFGDDDLLTLMGLGNACTAAGDVAAAATVFARAAAIHDSAAAWNNLALARSALGDRDGARTAARRALARAEAAEPRWRDAARATAIELGVADGAGPAGKP